MDKLEWDGCRTTLDELYDFLWYKDTKFGSLTKRLKIDKKYTEVLTKLLRLLSKIYTAKSNIDKIEADNN